MFSVFSLVALVPWTKLVHVFTSGFNVALTPQTPTGKLSMPFNMKEKTAEPIARDNPRSFGTKTVRDLTWNQLLSLDACTECGRCHEACPATQSGKKLSPESVIINLRDHSCVIRAAEK